MFTLEPACDALPYRAPQRVAPVKRETMTTFQFPTRKAAAAALLIGLTAPLIAVSAVDASSRTRTSGTGESVDVSWTEYDPDDLLGLPGNVHVGYLYVYSGPYGSFIGGNVTDFECAPGQTPWGGGHHVTEVVVDEATELVEVAVEEAVEEAIDSGAASIDADVIVDSIQSELSEEIPAVIVEETGACTYLQDRFLSGDGTATFKVNLSSQVAQITGTLTVSNGGHGEPGVVLGNPPVNLTITGGEWNKFEYSYSSKTAGYSYSDWQKGTSYYGGVVTGNIGGMGFADDVDDVAYGGFSSYKFRTVERIR